MQRRRVLLGLVLAVALVVGLAGAPSRGLSASSGGVLRIGTTNFPDSLNPFVGITGDSVTIWTYTYPHLILYDTRTYNLVGSFATSWTHTRNTWTFHTQPSWKWSDGTPITANDAAWTFNTNIKFQKTAAAVNSGYVLGIRSAAAPTPTTLVLHLSEPLSPSAFFSNLVQFPILPQHVWAKYAVGNGAQLKTFTNIPSSSSPYVSGGPFTVVSFKPNDTAILTQNPNWTGPKPHIQGWGYQAFSNDSAEVAALENGSLDYARDGIDATVVQALKAHGVSIDTSTSTVQIVLSVNAGHDRAHPELGNPLVREAFDYALDRNAMARTAYRGYAVPIEDGLIVPGEGTAAGTKLPWADPAIKPPAFNVAKANQLLDQAGFKMGANHTRLASGHPMSYSVILETSIGGPGYRLFSIMQQDFAQIGVKLVLKPLDYTAAINAVFAQHYGNWDMLLDFNGGPIDPNYMLNSFICAQLYSLNNAGYCDKKFDRLYNEQLTAPTTTQRVKLVWQMEKYFSAQRWYMGLVSFGRFNAWGKNFTGHVPGPNGDIFWTSMQSLLSVHQK
jgi:peptide/nickel transport system substrate-binding protein